MMTIRPTTVEDLRGLAEAKLLTGLIPGIADTVYHSNVGISFSGAKIIAEQSLAHFKSQQETPRKDTPAFILGRATHCAVLEPKEFDKRYAVAPECDRRTKEGKAIWEAAAASGKTLLKQEDYADIIGMTKKIREHENANRLLTGGEAELSGYWIDDETGVLCKCRPDYLHTRTGIVVDLKTCDDSSLLGFQGSIRKYLYHMQSAWYCDGLSKILGRKINLFNHVCVEKKPPYAVSVYTLDDASMDRARIDIKRVLKQYASALRTNEWPAYSEEIQNIAIPYYMFNEPEEIMI